MLSPLTREQQLFTLQKDIIVVGAGPVGLMLSLWLMESGRSVILYENRPFIRKQIVYIEKKFWDRVPPIVQNKLEHHGLCRYQKSSPTVCSAAASNGFVNVAIHT